MTNKIKINVSDNEISKSLVATKAAENINNWRAKLVVKYDSCDFDNPIDINDEQLKLFKAEMLNWDRRDLFRLNQIIIDVSAVIRKSDDPYLLLEMTALKLLEMDKSIYIDQLINVSLTNKNNCYFDYTWPCLRNRLVGQLRDL